MLASNTHPQPHCLSDLRVGQSAIIASVDVPKALAPRLRALGFEIGKRVQVVRQAPFSGPMHLRIGTTEIIMRRQDANGILLVA